MNGLTRFTDRDLTVLRALSLHVRLFSQRQLADSLFGGDIANARRRLRQLTELRLLKRKITLARPLPELCGPVVHWHPDYAVPDAAHVAFLLQNRWRFQAMCSTVVYLPTCSMINHFGGRHKTSLSSQVSHDLGVAAVWLWYWANQRADVDAWRGEDWLTDNEPGQSVPDAVLVDRHEQPTMLIEFGGDYSADRIASFHDDAAFRGLPYQIW